MKEYDEEKSGNEEMDQVARESQGKVAFGPEKHGIPKQDWPKKFVIDGGLKYDFGGPERTGTDVAAAVEEAESREDGEEAPGKTHEYDKSVGRIKAWPKKFKTDGESNDFDGGE